jgi:uncharacterized membrane protein YfcA
VWLTVEVVAAVAVAGAAQTISGVGFALIASPLLIFALGNANGVRMAVAMSLVLNAVVLAGMFKAVRWGDALRMLIPAAAVVIPTTFVSSRLNSVTLSAAAGVAILISVAVMASGKRAHWADGPAGTISAGAASGVLNVVAGVAILISVAVMASGKRAHWADGPAGTISAGAASGVLNVVAGVSGPPIALLVAHRDWASREGAATVQAYSLPLNAVTLPAIGLPTARPSLLLWSGLGLLAGVGLAWRFVDAIPAKAVRPLVLAVAAVGGSSLIARALL